MSGFTRPLALASLCLLLLGSATHLHAQAVSLNLTSLNFGNLAVGNTSTKSVVLKNTGTASLVISSVSQPGAPFSETNGCSAPLAQNKSCTISVTFSPTAPGAFNSSISIKDNAKGSPQIVSLKGAGVPQAALSPTTLIFGLVGVGTTSTAQTATLHNNLNTSLAITSITASGDFAVPSNTCGSGVPAGGQCQIAVTFTPSQLGIRSGDLTVLDSANNSPQTIPLEGLGTFAGLISIAVTPANVSIPVGSPQQFTATGKFPTGIFLDLTHLVYWSSSASNVATFSNPLGSPGRASGKAAGTTTITATSLNNIAGSTSLTVTSGGKITPTITWATPAAIIYGTPLSATQLDATANVAGTFAYNPAASTVLPAGSNALSVLFTPTDMVHYTTATASVTLTVNKATVTVTVSCPTTRQTYTGSALTPCTAGYKTSDGLSGTLTVSYTSNTNVGTAGASASYAGDANHAGSSGTGSFSIAQATSTVTVSCPATPQAYTGSALTPCTAGYKTSDGLSGTLTVSYTSNTNVGTAGASSIYAGGPTHAGSSGTGSFSIAQATSTVTVSCPSTPQAYT